MTFAIAPIVEGHGDAIAVPVLLRAMAPSLIVKRPVRFPRSQLIQDVAKAARIANSNIESAGALLLVIDADEDCAATLGPELERRLREHVPTTRLCRVVMPVREFENWIVGAASESRFSDADAIGDPKGKLAMQHGVYKETADQARLIATADLTALEQRSRSFRRLRRVLREFEAQAGAGE